MTNKNLFNIKKAKDKGRKGGRDLLFRPTFHLPNTEYTRELSSPLSPRVPGVSRQQSPDNFTNQTAVIHKVIDVPISSRLTNDQTSYGGLERQLEPHNV